MTLPAVLLPVFIQIGLTFTLLVMMGRARFAAIRAGQINAPKNSSPRQIAWPQKAQQIGDSYHNQFETPVLFYAVVALALITAKADFIFVALSWIYVGLRLVHAYIHVGANRLMNRYRVFLASVTVLISLWSWFALRILFGF